jgi:hypothetical protein
MADLSDNTYMGGVSIDSTLAEYRGSGDAPTYYMQSVEWTDANGKKQTGMASNTPIYLQSPISQAFEMPTSTMAASNFGGSLNFSPMSFNKTADGSWASTGGFNFDLPLATVAAFQNNALAFTANNAQANRGFLNNTIAMQSAGVNNIAQLSAGIGAMGLNAGFQIAQTNANVVKALADNALEYGKFSQEQITERTRIETQEANKSGKSGCYFTTAICEHWNMSDDCEMLETMRKFRDEIMLTNPELAPLVSEYYARAPEIVAKINARADSAEIWEYVGQMYLIPGVKLCRMGANKLALRTYKKLCEYLNKIAG